MREPVAHLNTTAVVALSRLLRPGTGCALELLALAGVFGDQADTNSWLLTAGHRARSNTYVSCYSSVRQLVDRLENERNCGSYGVSKVVARASRPCESCSRHTGETPVPLPSGDQTPRIERRASRFPAAAQRAVKCDGVEQTGGLELQKILLCGVKILLREENVHIAVHALPIARVSEVEAFLLST